MNTNPTAKRVLIYGDSLTWGRVPNKYERYDTNTRYTAVVQNELGTDFEVVEEGLRSRMAKGENLFVPNRNGFEQFSAIFQSQLPIDILVIFLGTNDTNFKANKYAEQIASDLESYLPLVKSLSQDMNMQEPAKIIFVAPPLINGTTLKPNSMFEGAAEKAVDFAKYISEMAIRNNVLFFDASQFAVASSDDGVHLDAENNIRLGKALAEFIKQN